MLRGKTLWRICRSLLLYVKPCWTHEAMCLKVIIFSNIVRDKAILYHAHSVNASRTFFDFFNDLSVKKGRIVQGLLGWEFESEPSLPPCTIIPFQESKIRRRFYLGKNYMQLVFPWGHILIILARSPAHEQICDRIFCCKPRCGIWHIQCSPPKVQFCHKCDNQRRPLVSDHQIASLLLKGLNWTALWQTWASVALKLWNKSENMSKIRASKRCN